MINKLISSIATVITFGRALVRGQGDNWNCQIQKDDTKNNIPRVEGFGLTSYPPNESNAVILFRGGNKRDGIIVSISSKDGKPDLEQGEVAIHNSSGVFVKITKDGTVLIEGGDLLVNGHDISDNQGIAKSMNSMRGVSNGHTHTVNGVETSPPIQQM